MTPGTIIRGLLRHPTQTSNMKYISGVSLIVSCLLSEETVASLVCVCLENRLQKLHFTVAFLLLNITVNLMFKEFSKYLKNEPFGLEKLDYSLNKFMNTYSFTYVMLCIFNIWIIIHPNDDILKVFSFYSLEHLSLHIYHLNIYHFGI